MARYSHYDMAGKVNSLKANLDERYKEFFCVVQELLQNADDASATQIIIGQLEKLSDKHELCKIPGIFVINNGPVTDSDLDHLFSIADSNKGEDDGKIGKFGLGMKSVFHLCETFFIFGHQSSGTHEPKILEFFDPWDNKDDLDAMPSPHPEWRREVAKNRDSLWHDVQQFLGKYHDFEGNWFGLWLPLRQRNQCTGGSGALLDYYPLENGSKEWFSTDDFRKISGMMPFFKHLRKVSFVAGWLDKFGSLEMQPRHNSAFTGNKKNEWEGVIVSDKNILRDLTYRGWEWYGHKELDALRNNDLWPITKCWDNGNRCWRDQKDKTAPHSAICYCTEKLNDNVDTGILNLQECVFLPLSDMRESLRLHLPCNITMSFHGQYFVDAGRRKYKLEDDKSVDDIKIRWNNNLRSQLLLPKVLQTLSEYFKDWDIDVIRRFIQCFTDSVFYSRSQEDICQKSQFLLSLTKNGWNWKREDADAIFMLLPDVKRPELLQQVYSRINKQYLLVQQNSPRLGTKQETQWPAEQAGKLWDSIIALDEKTRYDEITLNFLEESVGLIKTKEKQLAKIQKFFGSISMSQYRNAREQLGRILYAYPHCNIPFAKDNWTTVSFGLWKKVLELVTDCLPLDLPLDENIKFKYSESDLKNILPKLESTLDGQSDNNCRAIVRDLVCSIFRNSDVDWINSQFAEFRLFNLQDKLLSFKELRKMNADHRLFRFGGSETNVMQAIQRAVIWGAETLPHYYCDALKQILSIDVFSARIHVQEIFAAKPELSAPSERIDLLKKLKSENDTNNLFLAVRYLLHGQKAYYDYDDDIEITNISTADRDLYEIGERLLRSINANKPQFDIPAELIAVFSEAEMENFGVKKLRFEAIIRKLVDYTSAQKETMCQSWRNPCSWFHLVKNLHTAEELRHIAALPIWPCLTGGYTELNEKCYLELDIAIPHILSSEISQLAIADNEQIELLRNKFPAIKIWNDCNTVRYCTKLNWSAECVEEIWDAVESHSETWNQDDLHHIFVYRLFETTSHRWISFLQIIPNFYWPSAELYSVDSLTLQSLKRWGKLARCGIPEKSEWTRYLYDRLSGDSEFVFGSMPEPLCNIENFRKLFMDRSIMPVLQLLDELAEKIDSEEFLYNLRGQANTQRLSKICSYISKRIEQCNEPFFMEYLKYFVGEAKKNQVDWQTVSLPDTFGYAKPCTELIRNADGVELQYILHPELQDYFSHQEVEQHDKNGIPQFSDSANMSQEKFSELTKTCGETLQEYFVDWPEDLYPAIGAFMYLAGNNHMVHSVAREYIIREPKQLCGKISEEFATEIEKYTLIVEIFKGQSLIMPSLAGTEISVPLQQDSEVESLLIGEDCYSCRLDGHPQLFVFLALRPVRVDSKEFGVKLLINTVKKLLGRFHAPEENVPELFEEMKAAEQFDLQTTRSLILKDLPPILRTMSLRGNTALKELLREWNNNNKYRTQAELQNKTDLSGYDRKFHDLLNELRELFENYENIRQETLTAIRRRISTAEYGYDADSIPFELFQNADDAAVELQMMQGIASAQKSSRQAFVIELTDNALNIIHWGRPLNQYQYPGFDHEQGERLGFGDDLQKMLLLGVSDKNEDSIKRTGKFGLGFKSAFLLTDKPLISSNRLSFSIQGGLLPKPADPDEKKMLEDMIQLLSTKLVKDDNKATIFHLPFRNGIKFDLNKFKSAAPLLIRFSRKINEIYIIDHSGTQTVKDDRNDPYDVWDLGTIKLAMGKCDDIPSPLQQLSATIWVTSPTQITQHFGFAVNGDFCIDVGRNQLLKCDENTQIALHAADELFKLLEMTESKRSAEFWENLWALFSNSKNCGLWATLRTNPATNQVLTTLIWGSSRDEVAGYGKFLRHHQVLPSGLSGKYSVLTALDTVRVAADEHLSVFWPLFSEFAALLNFKPGEIIGYDTALAFDNIYGKNFILPFSISVLMQKCTAKCPELSPVTINNKAWGDFTAKHGSIYQESCAGFKFLNQNGKYCSPAALLIPGDSTEEESLRAAFAPSSALISDKYDNNALLFFRYARKRMGISVDTMSKWALAAESNDARNAVCSYLDVGELHKQLADQISKDLNNLHSENWLHEWNNKQSGNRGLKYLFLDQLKYVESQSNASTSVVSETTSMPPQEDEDTRAVLPCNTETQQAQNSPAIFWRKFAADWQILNDNFIRKYNQKLYEADRLEQFPLELKTMEDRDRWMRLFTLGAAHSLGRTKLEQHTGFVRWSKERRYWDTFIDPDIVAGEWLKVLDKHIENNDPEYGYWLRLYPCIYLFAKYLDEYVEMFCQWKDETELVGWRDLAEFRNNHIYSGTDFTMPDLKMGLGNIGMHFVFRELWRSNTLRVPGMEKYCFVHSQQNRQYFDGNVNSESMYNVLKEHLDDPTFGGQFDVAFSIIPR